MGKMGDFMPEQVFRGDDRKIFDNGHYMGASPCPPQPWQDVTSITSVSVSQLSHILT